MFNFSSKVKLDSQGQRKYLFLKFLLYLFFILGSFYLAYILLFPSFPFNFFFRNPDSLKNTLVDLRDINGKSLKSGKIKSGENFLFNANIDGDYSKVVVKFSLEKGSLPFNSGSITLRKSFRSFFYPEGKPMETSNEKAYKIGSKYYLLKDNVLSQFVSEKAYLTRFKNNQAISETESFLNNYTVSEKLIGFSDGTLISSGESIFIADGDKIYPIADPITFESMKFNWNDVIPADGEEFSIYEKQKLFTMNSPHPDGTVFITNENKKYYLIKNGEKRGLVGQDIINSYSTNTPIEINESGLTTKSSCQINQPIKFINSFECEISLEQFKGLRGNDFEFAANFGSDIQLKDLNATFKKSVNLDNLKLSISNLKKRTAANYGGEQ